MLNNAKHFCEECPNRANVRKQACDDMVDAIYRAMPNGDEYETKSFVAYVLEEFHRENN